MARFAIIYIRFISKLHAPNKISAPFVKENLMDNSFRMFNCSLCSAQVIMCRPCDRGNIYCSIECASKRRQGSQRRARSNYQRSQRGRQTHALRQARYRARMQSSKTKVTDHGSNSRSDGVTNASNGHATKPVLLQSDSLVCARCSGSVGAFGRFAFWQGGRHLRKQPKPRFRSPTPIFSQIRRRRPKARSICAF
jgi:hypothetical protein